MAPSSAVNSLRVDVDMEQVKHLCRKWHIAELAIYGSALRDDFRPDSDIDLLITFAEDTAWGLAEQMELEDDFTLLFGREVDVTTRRAVERSENYLFRRHVLGSAVALYVDRVA